MKRWLAVLLLCGLIAACQPIPDTGAAEAALCTSLGTLKTAVTGLADTSGTTTVGELKEASRNVTEAWSTVKASAAALDQARVNDLDQAVNSLGSAVNDVSDDATLEQATASIQEEMSAVNTAWDGLNSAANCP